MQRVLSNSSEVPTWLRTLKDPNHAATFELAQLKQTAMIHEKQSTALKQERLFSLEFIWSLRLRQVVFETITMVTMDNSLLKDVVNVCSPRQVARS